MPRSSLLRLDVLAPGRVYTPLLLRLFLGTFLVYMSQDNVLSWDRMREFERFLAGNGFPAPLYAACLSAYAQFACGLLILAGALTRWASLAMVINFAVALIGVHIGLPFETWLPPLAMLTCALVLLLNGAGRVSIDEGLR